MTTFAPNPDLDLVLERTVAVAPELVPHRHAFARGRRLHRRDPHRAGRRRPCYTATAIHGDAATRKQHEEMGFGEGWSAALDQLVELAESL